MERLHPESTTVVLSLSNQSDIFGVNISIFGTYIPPLPGDNISQLAGLYLDISIWLIREFKYSTNLS